MIMDPVLSQRLESVQDRGGDPPKLTMYITYQPCHYSSGRVENAHATGETSAFALWHGLTFERPALCHLLENDTIRVLNFVRRYELRRTPAGRLCLTTLHFVHLHRLHRATSALAC
eukprot:SAG31_NODE_6573_length_1967_cov_19.547919_2_plen_116_part_00